MFIDNLNIILEKNNMSGNELCKKLGISTSNYTYWKKNLPRADIIIKISDILNTSTDFLLGKEKDHIEGEIISFYRKADDRGKDRIYKTAKDEADQAEQLLQKNNLSDFLKENKPFA